MLRTRPSKADPNISIDIPVKGPISVRRTSTSHRRGLFGYKRMGLFVAPILLLVLAAIVITIYIPQTSIQRLGSLAVSDPVCGTWDSVLVPSSGSLTSVSATSSDDVWFVGPGSFAHWDGKSISMLPSPDVKADDVVINDTAFISPTDGWAVGSLVREVDSSRQSELLLLHWDGSAWNTVPTPSLDRSNVENDPQSLSIDATDVSGEALAVISADDIWAVGSYPQEGVSKTLTLHWDGAEWRVVPSPNIKGTDNYLLAIASLSRNDVWAFGFRKVGRNAWENQPLSIHWDGTSWQVRDNPATLAEIRSASVSPTKDLWVTSLAVNAMSVQPNGGYGLGSAVMEQGRGWKELLMPKINDPIIRSIVALSSNDVWAVGNTGTYTLAAHWDGKEWSEVPTLNPSSLQGFVDVAAVGSSVWAVGWSADDFGSPHKSTITHFIGCSTSPK